MSFDINLLRNLITLAAFLGFAGIVWWAYAPRRKEYFEEAAHSVLEDDLK